MVTVKIDTTNVQLQMVLDGFHCPTSACPKTGSTKTADRSPSIDLESWSGASTRET